MNEWHTPSPKKTFRQPSSCGVGCSHTVNGGRYAALSGSQESCDFDLPMMMMEYSDPVPGDVPTGNAKTKESVVRVLAPHSSVVLAPGLKTIWDDPEMKHTLHQRPFTGLVGEESEVDPEMKSTLHQRQFTGLIGEETEEGARSTKLLPASSSGNTDNSQDFQVLEDRTSPTPEGGGTPRGRGHSRLQQELQGSLRSLG